MFRTIALLVVGLCIASCAKSLPAGNHPKVVTVDHELAKLVVKKVIQDKFKLAKEEGDVFTAIVTGTIYNSTKEYEMILTFTMVGNKVEIRVVDDGPEDGRGLPFQIQEWERALEGRIAELKGGLQIEGINAPAPEAAPAEPAPAQ